MVRSAAAMAVMAVLLASAVDAQQGAPAASPPAPPYTNHTVGSAAGWFFNATSNSTSGNYSTWAATETFYLGDYLIFKTNDNSSVVQTTNATTYSLCDPSDDEGPETNIYSGGGAGAGGLEETHSVAVPLTFEGTNYFFSEADGGMQCEQGMRFEIKVAHGRGLPPNLVHPPPAPKWRVLAPPPYDAVTSPAVVGGTGAGDMEGNNGGCRAVGVGGQFLGVAIGVGLAIFHAV